MPEPVKKIVAYVPPEIYEAIRDMAHEQRISQSAVVRRALDEYLKSKNIMKRPD